MKIDKKVLIIGAGPAGLTASYLLSKEKVSSVVLEADTEYVGGISRTVNYKGYRFDIGGHRFFSKSEEVEKLWSELLPNDMLNRPRSSKIYYNKKFFAYPLKAIEALLKLGFFESCRCVLSYLKARISPTKNPKNFEDWVSNNFGKRLFNIFFKTYTEKVWGMDCKTISADWAAQRIKGLSLGTAIWNAIFSQKSSRDKSQVIKTLIDSFRYPRLGPGMMWEAAAQKTHDLGGDIFLGCNVTAVAFNKETEIWTTTYTDSEGNEKNIDSYYIISSMPMRDLIKNLTPSPSSTCVAMAEQLKYRDFITVTVILKDRKIFSDNWIYIHDPNVKVGRIQNFKSWSPELVPDSEMCSYGLEYFCFEGDNLWSSTDADLINLAKSELTILGLANSEDIVDACVIRQPKAYPVYDENYSKIVDCIRKELVNNYPNLHLVGRNGMHKYNNQDHAMMTAMLTTKNIILNEQFYDVWNVNSDAEYHEEKHESNGKYTGLRMVPDRVNA